MNVYIANFGRENYEWPECLRQNSIATMNEVGDQALWEAGDKEGYIARRMSFPDSKGRLPIRPVASRWYNLMTIISESNGDIWVHREKDQLWWTVSLPDPPSFVEKKEPVEPSREVVICHKPCNPWSNENKHGNRLDWNSLHPKAQDFLFTEGTLQKLSADYALYAKALIDGDNLEPWHSQDLWRQKAEASKSKHSQGTVFSRKQIAAYRMVKTALSTVVQADGSDSIVTKKVKDSGFESEERFRLYVESLIDMQEGLCALTGIPLQFDGASDDEELLCSLDRIDSDGHYEEGNLQIVCRFCNRWKGASDDAGFRRLIEIVREN